MMDLFSRYASLFLLLLPLFSGCLALLPGVWPYRRVLTLLTGGLCSCIVLLVWSFWPNQGGELHFQFQRLWMPFLGVEFSLGIDRLSLVFLSMLNLIYPLVISRLGAELSLQRSFYIAVLFFYGALHGLLLSTDAVLFYFFWEAAFVPLVFIFISCWQVKYSAIQSFLFFSLISSLLLLFVIVSLMQEHYVEFGFVSSRMTHLYALKDLSIGEQVFLFIPLFFSFGVRLGFWPLHSWLVAFAKEAKAVEILLLLGLFTYSGVYGFIRFAVPLFPEVIAQEFFKIAVFLLVGMLIALMLSWIAKSREETLTYMLSAMMGLVCCGLFLQGKFSQETLVAGVMETCNQFVVFPLCLLLPYLRQKRFSTKTQQKMFSALYLFLILAVIGFPGFSGFPGKLVISLALLDAHPLLGVGVVFFIFFSAMIFFKLYKEDMGLPSPSMLGNAVKTWEFALIAMLLLLSLWVGVHPASLWKVSQSRFEVEHHSQRVEAELLEQAYSKR